MHRKPGTLSNRRISISTRKRNRSNATNATDGPKFVAFPFALHSKGVGFNGTKLGKTLVDKMIKLDYVLDRLYSPTYYKIGPEERFELT